MLKQTQDTKYEIKTYQPQIAKFDNWAIATPPTKFGVVS